MKPLSGLKILDLTRLLPGPVATLHLADMGAEVIKIEDPGIGDYARTMMQTEQEIAQGHASAFFRMVNRGKAPLVLDFKQAADKERFLNMVESADAVVESFRPGVMDKLGLGYDDLAARNPKIVLCAISGYGASGPLRLAAGHDINYVGYAGALDQITAPDGRPALSNLQIGDLLGGSLNGVMGILAALLQAQRTGQGCFVDVSMTDGVLAHNIMAAVAANQTGHAKAAGTDLLNGGVPCYNVYRTYDNRWMAFGALELKFWQAACDVLGKPEWKQSHWSLGQEVGGAQAKAMQTEMDALFATKTQAEWNALFEVVDCCVTPVLKMEEALAHPLFKARAMAIHTDNMTHMGLPIQFVSKQMT